MTIRRNVIFLERPLYGSAKTLVNEFETGSRHYGTIGAEGTVVSLTTALVIAIYTMAAATAGIWLKLLGVSWDVSALISAVLTLLAAQVHASFLRRSDRRAARLEIAALRQAGFEFSKELGETRQKIDELKSDMEAKATAQSRKIISELSMIEGLMREFAAKIAEKVRSL